MKRRWSFGVVVAIAVAIAVASFGHPSRASHVRAAAAPVDVTLALESDGLEVRVAHQSLAVTFKF
ncbi:MAG: hypothetical protein JNL81_11530 [Hyphomonadaceae bacterium]|nr:hypothetical protein [Hyphomonadaceae bacterium]